ncbi:IPT/TIG domain-containing protein [Flagellimonas olearia]|uniref:IPT/TIG domain-containing protein n=1 Tax=Flagellimonas olearia TaxID=552546 RepID=A0A444VKG2_9FLAO|nr:IPT/TIG domain-containing protein [Allomuricauda olearia]RYC51265.1 hypothetical protein DN53_13740 [Allomuricauda olearia]
MKKAILIGLSLVSMTFYTSCNENEDVVPELELEDVQVLGVSPEAAQPGTVVTITGKYFSRVWRNNIVKFNGVQAEVNSASTRRLDVVVPEGASSGPISVAFRANSTTSSFDFTVLEKIPTISRFSPTSGAAGTYVSIEGTNFKANPQANIVRFGDVEGVVIKTDSAATKLKVKVPEGAVTGKISVTADSLTGESEEDFVVQ